MGFKTLEEIHAYNLTREFKLEVYRLIEVSSGAQRDARFRSQVQEALSGAESNIGEGFARWGAGEFARFLAIAVASLKEGQLRVQDGIDRRYFPAADCQRALRLGERAFKATASLRREEERLAAENRRRRNRRGKDPGPKDQGRGPKT
jgi:four helix bundle protein